VLTGIRLKVRSLKEVLNNHARRGSGEGACQATSLLSSIGTVARSG